MKTKSLAPFYLIFTIFLSANFSYSQIIFDEHGNYVIPVETESYYNGKIILNSNDTLTGAISLNYRKKDIFYTLLKDETSKIKNISNEEIKKIQLVNNSQCKNSYTEFERLNSSMLLYRIIDSGKVKIYDSSSRPFTGNLVSGVFIKEGDQVSSLFDFWTSGPKKDLINYINNRDNKNFRNRDFKSIDDIIAYLNK